MVVVDSVEGVQTEAVLRRLRAGWGVGFGGVSARSWLRAGRVCADPRSKPCALCAGCMVVVTGFGV